MKVYLERKGYSYSAVTVHKYMNTELDLRSIVRPKKPGYEHGKPHKVFDNQLNCFLASNFPHFHRYDSLKSALYIHAVSKNINTFPKNQGRIRAAIAVKILDFTVMYR